MPPSLRNRAQPSQSQDPSDTDSGTDLFPSARRMRPAAMEEEDLDNELVGVEGDEDLEEDEEALAAPQTPLPNLDPPPPYLREVSTLASWTVSSSKPGCSILQLRHPSTSLFWQSDGPQPHYLNIHFFKLVRIVGLRLYLDFEQDESYTPTKIVFLAGSGMNDLQEWGEMKLENPRGWIWADFSQVGDLDSDDEEADEEDEDQRMIEAPPVGLDVERGAQDASSDSENSNPRQPMHIEQTPQHQQVNHTYSTATITPTSLPNTHFTPTLPRPQPRLPFAALSPNTMHQSQALTRSPKMPVLRAHLVQIKILENHQNGKDTHLRGLQIFARNDEREVLRIPVRRVMAASAKGVGGAGERNGRERIGKYELGGFEEDRIR